MSRELFMDILRTLLKAAGGYLLSHAGKYGLDSAGWDTITGAVLVIGGLVWSWYSTYTLTEGTKSNG
jgi:hypothetical protein